MKHFSWAKQHVVLTGATGGLGAELARQFSALGARVTLVGRNQETLSELAEQLQQPCLAADLLAPDFTEKLATYVQAQHQHPVTGLINNAAITQVGLFSQTTSTSIERVVQTNLIVPMLSCQKIMPLLPDADGWIMNIGSVFGAIGYPGQALYSASKFGLRGFTQALQREVGAQGIKVFYCAPRAIRTSMNQGLMSAMNKLLKTKEDSPAWVARQIINQIATGRRNQTLGWPEKLFARMNGLLPSMVDSSMKKPRAILKKLSQEYPQ
ncbi:SDR family oxidoreductase [Pseudidiomarina gelatinasegens]|uniref:SDR family oxidoreductase n=1 Tax=Pseudidiomarina gelatinasegens TaxID=2487740 RepID=UPI003A9789B7